MAEKKRPGRREWLNDFHATVSGDYVYEGKTHRWQSCGMSRRAALGRLWIYAAAASACIIGAGCLPAAGMMNCAYVLLPYAGAVIAQAALIWLMCRLSSGGEALRDYVYRATVEKLRPRAMTAVVFCALTMLGNGLYIVLNGSGGRPWAAACFYMLMLPALAAQLMWLRLALRLRWEK